MRKYIKKRKGRIKHKVKKIFWKTFVFIWFVAFLIVVFAIYSYSTSLKNQAPFEGKKTYEECMSLQENSMRSLCLERLADSELFKKGAGVCDIVWEWKGGGSHDMLNNCYSRAAKYFRNPDLCRNLKKYGMNTNTMYNPDGYESGCLKELFQILTDGELASFNLSGICSNLRWRFENEKSACLAKYK